MSWMQCDFIQISPVWADSDCNISPPIGGGLHPSQGFQYPRQRTKEDVRKGREAVGLVEKVIETVAQRQVERLETDDQKRLEELHRELELEGVEWDSKYLESLNLLRERLISAEIARRLKLNIFNEETTMLLLMAAAL